eukprot:5737737-Karenia_brevis.AAC.1
MEENVVEEIQMDLPPSPIPSVKDDPGPPWPSGDEDSFLVLPGKGNAKSSGPDGPQNPVNMVAEPN